MSFYICVFQHEEHKVYSAVKNLTVLLRSRKVGHGWGQARLKTEKPARNEGARQKG